ncbi:MAG: hypothetical protein ACK53Y_03155, partial [bacterium]
GGGYRAGRRRRESRATRCTTRPLRTSASRGSTQAGSWSRDPSHLTRVVTCPRNYECESDPGGWKISYPPQPSP